MMAIGLLEYLERSAIGGWMLRFSASSFSWESVKDSIKGLPREDRFWNSKALGGRGAWWVSDEGLAQIASLFVNYQEMRERADQRRTYTHEERRSYSGSSSSSSSSSSSAPSTREKAFATLYLLPTAPAEVAEAAYRALAKIYHPDYGGDLDRMKQINAAHDMVKASFPSTGGR